MSGDGYILELPPDDDPPEDNEPGTIRVSELNDDGTWTHTSFEMPDSLKESLARARSFYRECEEAGTPYWCTHEGRSVSHPRAQWKDDTPEDPIHRKHGVICLDCGGYIQEG